jgi:cobaltochelatase CobN
LSTPDLNSLPSLPRDKDGPTFAEPWQGQAFGLAVRLSEEGHFTWKEWAAALAEELKAVADRGERIQDGHLFVCNGCCCGHTEKGFPALPLEQFKQQWKERGIRRRFHLTISGCLGPCPLANVVLLLFRGRSAWFHSINSPEDVASLYGYVERMLLAESYLDPPPELACRLFERYIDQTAEAECYFERTASGCR